VRDQSLEDLIVAGPRWQRPGKRLLLALAKRPRGLALLRRFSPADQAGWGLVAMAHYDQPEAAKPLGWDADAVAARGRDLRREEGRP
jgi:hypothetical protein